MDRPTRAGTLDGMNPSPLEKGRGEAQVTSAGCLAETGEGDVEEPMELFPEVDKSALGARGRSDPQLIGELGEGPRKISIGSGAGLLR